MARKRFIETHSNFTIKQVHQNTTKGKIFERDYTTISEMDSFAPGQVPVYADGNMKITVRNGVNTTVKHNYGGYLMHECNGEQSKVWTLACLDGSSGLTSASKIKIRPNTTNFLDFACYGSAVELIRASVSDILLRFPAELYLSDQQFGYYASTTSTTLTYISGPNGETLYRVMNPFAINVHALSYQDYSGVNKLRYFCESYDKYDFIPDYLEEKHPIEWGVTYEQTIPGCLRNGDLIMKINVGQCNLYYYYYEGERLLFHDYIYGTAHVRPNGNVLDEFYDSLDDLQYILLNRATNHEAKFETPYETDRGVFTRLERYKWPTVNGWNLDFDSIGYDEYIQSLTDLAEMYDAYYSDRLASSITHEAIKNFDWTNKTVVDDHESEEQVDPNPYRMESVLHIYGRMFDELKRYASNIKTANNVSYDGNRNTPDYFLTDALQMAGWEVRNPLNIDKTIVTDPLYPGTYYGYTANDANNLFMRLLKLNSKAILSAKGTKRGLEMMLAMFGFHSMEYYQSRKYERINADGSTTHNLSWDDLTDEEKAPYYATSYTFNEFVGVAQDTNVEGMGYSNCQYNDVVRINQYKDNFNYRLKAGHTYNDHQLQGLPVKCVELVMDNGETSKYLIPWFDKNERYDNGGEFYFQSKGGWGAQRFKYTNVSTFGSIDLQSDEALGFTIYDENVKYLHFANAISNLFEISEASLSNGDIYYVEDISEWEDYTGFEGTPSHYFYLVDTNNSDIIGITGWKNVSVEEITGQTTFEGKRVIYLEAIEEERDGNGPHMGYGDYDGGSTYLSRFNKIFTGATFEKVSANRVTGFDTIGFDVEKQVDNVKCWYFTDTTSDKNDLLRVYDTNQFDVYDASEMDDILVGAEFENTIRTCSLNPFNMEDKVSGSTFDEAAANSIINLKDFTIDFYPNARVGYSLYDFINNVVMFYLKQLIPSTVLLSYFIPDVGLSQRDNSNFKAAFATQCPTNEANLFGVVEGNSFVAPDMETTRLTVFAEEPVDSEDTTTTVFVNTNEGWYYEIIGNRLDVENADTLNETSEYIPAELPYIHVYENNNEADAEDTTVDLEVYTNDNWRTKYKQNE